MCLRRSAGGGLTVDSPQYLDPHQPPHSLSDCRHALLLLPSLHPAGPEERGLQVLPVDLAHQGQVLFRGRLGTIVNAGTGHPQQCLPPRKKGGRTAAPSATSAVPGPLSVAGVPGSWTRPLRQEIPLHLELSDLLVKPGDQGGGVPGLLFLTVAEDAGGTLSQSFLLSLYLARVDLIPGRQQGHRLLVLQRRVVW